MANKGYTRTKAQLEKEEEAVFAAFGIGEGEVSLRDLIRGQRKINGKLYRAIGLILESLRNSPERPLTLHLTRLRSLTREFPAHRLVVNRTCLLQHRALA